MPQRSFRGLLLLPVLLLVAAAAVWFADLKGGEDLLIQRKYGEAATALAAALPDLPVEERPRGEFLLGHARLLAGDPAAALAVFERIEREHPDAPVADASRFLAAKACERQGDLRRAAEIYRDEIERLVGLARKEEVAATYLGLAEKALAVTPPQHERAVTFFDLALDLGLPPMRAAVVRLRAAESLLAIERFADAIPRLRAVLPALAGQREAPRALLALGRALRRSGDPAGSRVVLRDLLALELPADDPIAGDAAYEIALSHGAPTPVPGELDRAIAALRALQQQHPGHPKARTAEFAIARCQAHCGRTSDALAALARFLAAAGDSGLPEVADARAMVGDVLFGQSELERAIAAYGDYLRLHPAHSEWERVQRAIVDAEYGMAVADQQRGASGFESARTRFEAFVQKHPLDARNPEIHARLGDMLVEEERYDEARAAYARCVAKYPGKPASSRAQFAIGRLHETRKFDYEAALAAYRAVEGPLAPQARAAIAQLTRKSLELQTAHVFRTDEQPVFAIRSRNIEQVRVRIYRLGLEDYFRATHTIAGVDRLDIEIIAPDRTFESAVEGYRRHQETERDVAIGFTEPGAYVVKVDDRELEATTMVLVSDLALISKSNRHEFFVFTQDTRRGEPAGGVRVVLSDGEKVLAEGATGPDGVYRFAGDALQARDRLVVFAVAPSGSGASSLPLSGLGFSPGLQPKGYLYTDRPLYGPGQTVQLKGILREIANGLYRVPAGAGYRLHVSRPNGRPLRTEALELSAFGTFASALELPVDAELGTWTIAVSRPDGPDFRGTFEVGKYERPRLAVALELEEPVVFRGERIQGRAVLRHFYGEPAVGKPVVLTLRLPDGAVLEQAGTTNALGEVPFGFGTGEFGEEAFAQLTATVTGENVSAMLAVPVVTTELTACVRTVRPVYLAGESFEAIVEVADRSGRPLHREATVVLSRLEDDHGRIVEVEVGRQRTTTAADGAGRVAFRAAAGGEHRLRVEVQDRFGTLVTGVAAVCVSGDDDAQKLRLFSDRDTYRSGETAAVKVMNRAGARLALLCWQGDGILRYETRRLPAGESMLELPIDAELAPNFALALAMIDGEHFHRAERDFRVERDLRLELAVPATAAPGDEVEIGVVARDAEGRPVTAELSLALVDEALLAIAGPGAPAIVPFFRGELRETEFRTASSCTWSYRGASRPVNDELVAEERRAELEREVAEQQRLLVRGFAGDELDERPSVFLTQNEALGGAVAFDRRQLGLESLSQVQSATALPSLDWQAVVAGQFGVAGYFPATRDPAAASGNRRTDFRETGAWIAQLATDADGRASATVKLPDSTTAWQVRVAGVTLATEVGEATATLHSKRALQVGIVAPPLLLEGDEADVRLTAHNLGAAAVELELLWQLATGERGSAEQQLAAQTEVERLLHVAAGTGELRELELALSGRAAELSDEVRAAIPIVPFGIEMQDGAAGSTRDRARLLLGLPAGREYSALALTIDVGPDPGRDLIAAALDRGYLPHNCRMTQGTNLALAARGVAALQVLDYVEAAGSASRVERDSLRQAARGVVSALVGHQRDDGAYTWAGRSNPDLRSTCAAVRLFAAARAHGFEGTDEAFHRAGEWLQQQLRTAKAGPRADIVWALADAGEARFESLNSLLRVHSTLEADDLARLALAFQRFGRPEAAGEVLATLRDRLTALERLPLATVGLATAALLASDRRDVAGGRALAFLLAQRRGAGWGTPEATAAAIRAITLAERTGAGAPRALAVTVACNGVTLTPIADGDVDAGALTARYVVPAAAVQAADNRIELAVEGGGEAFYRASLTGFARGFLKRDQNDQAVRIRRSYLAPPRRHEGREVPSGFGCIEGRGYKSYQNEITQLRVGESCRVESNFWLRREGDRDTMTPLVVEEPIPAGCSVPPDSVRGGFEDYELLPGRIVFFFRDGNASGAVQYELQARFPGTYRILPTQVQSALRPEFRAFGPPGRLVVHPRGSDRADDYRLTPDELLHLGTAYFDAGESAVGAARRAAFELAWQQLRTLLDDWHRDEFHLRDSALKEVARMMLHLGIERGEPRTVVRFFEVLKDRYPELVIPFDRIVAVGRSYLDLGEFEAALLVFRATAEASFLKDAAVANALAARGEFLASNRFLEQLLATYPDLATMRIARYSVGQQLAARAAEQRPDQPVDERVGTAAELRARAATVLRDFLVLYPEDPLADEVSFAWATTHVEGGDLERALAVAEAARQRYPGSAFEDELRYTEGYALFALGRHDEAFAQLKRVAEQQFPRPNAGGSGSAGLADSESKWHAVFLQGQIHHARGEIAAALADYDRVADRFGDASEAADWFRSRQLEVPEVSTFRLDEAPRLELACRNLKTANVQVFKVDLMRLYVTERSLRDIRGVELHGIRPQLAFDVELGSGRDYRTLQKSIDLELPDPGAYLVVVRAGDELGSGMVLRSDITIEAEEQLDAGRIRLHCKRGDAFLAGAHVKIGAVGMAAMKTASTDLRGIASADGLIGPATAIVQQGAQFAFYRGSGVHQPGVYRPTPTPPVPQPDAAAPTAGQRFDALENNLRYNNDNRGRQIHWLEENVLQKDQRGVEVYKTK